MFNDPNDNSPSLCLSETSPESVEHHDVYENSYALIESAQSSMKESYSDIVKKNSKP